MHLTSRLWYLLGHNHGDIIIKYIPFPVLLGGMDAGEREQAAGLLGSVVWFSEDVNQVKVQCQHGGDEVY